MASTLRLAVVARILHDDPHAVTAIVIREITHDPNAGMIHLDDRGNALRRSEPQHRHFRGFGTGLPSSATTLKVCPGKARLRISVALPFRT